MNQKYFFPFVSGYTFSWIWSMSFLLKCGPMFHFCVFFTIGLEFLPSQLCQNPFIARTLLRELLLLL